MRRAIIIISAVFIICIAFSACNINFLPTQSEIEEFAPVQVVGIDRCEGEPSLVEVTFIGQIKSSGKEGGESSVIHIVSDTGRTVFEAERKVKARSTKRYFFGYVDYFLIGEEAAKEDLNKYFDFIIRGHEIRLSPKVYVVREGSAKELLFSTSSEDRFILDKLDSFEREAEYLSGSGEVKVIEIANMLEDRAVVIPSIKCEGFRDKKIIGKMPEKDVSLSGYAIFKDAVLSGYIDREYSRGYNFLIDKIGSCPVNVTDETGKTVALEVLEGGTKVKAKFNGDDLEEAVFSTLVLANVTEQHSLEDVFKKSALDKMAAEMSEIIKKDMERVLAFSKEKRLDCVKLGQRIETSHPYKWEKIKENWDKIYPGLSLKVEVEAHIARSYDIQEPSGSKGGKE